MTSTRIVATAAATAVALTSLTACSGTNEPGNQSTASSTETVVSTATVTSEQTSAPAPAGAAANTKELPRAVTGYTDEARAEMAEDGLAEADVQAVVDAAHAGDAEVGGVTTDTGNSGGKASTSTSPRTAWCARPTGDPIAV